MILLNITKSFLKKPRYFSFIGHFKQDVLILVNREGRDVLGLFLVYAYLKYVFKKGVRIKSAIYQKYFWIKLYQPQVVVSVNIDCPSTVNCYKMMKEYGITCLMSPTEVFPVTNPKDLVNKYEFKNIVDGVLLPGERMKEIYIENNKISPAQAFPVGFPTFDFTRKEFRKYFITKKEFCRQNNIPENHKLILFVSSFSMADYNMKNWDKECFHWPESLTKERALAFKADSIKAREIAITSLSKLLKKHSDWHVLVRKHPIEDGAIYEKLFARSGQITYWPDEQIYDLLSVSDAIVHWNSTVSAIAFGMNKPTVLIDLEKEFFMDKEDAITQKGNYICANQEQVEEALVEIFNKGGAVPEEQKEVREQFAKRWLSGLDGEASFRTAKLIAEFVKENKNTVRTQMSILELARGVINSLKYILWFWLARFIKMVLSKQNYSKFIPKLKKYDKFYIEFTRLRYENGIKEHLLNSVVKHD